MILLTEEMRTTLSPKGCRAGTAAFDDHVAGAMGAFSFVQARTTATRISVDDIIMQMGMKAWLTNAGVRQDSGSALAIRGA